MLYKNMAQEGYSILGCFYGALVSLLKDLSVSEHLRFTVQLWGLYSSGFSLVWGPFLAC
jgi:hypothetical protein